MKTYALILSGLILGLSFNVNAQPVERIPGGHVSGGGEREEQELCKEYRDPFRDFLQSPQFPTHILLNNQINPAFLDGVLESLRITTVTEKIPGLRPGDKNRSMRNYWEGKTPRVDVDLSELALIGDEKEKIRLFIHEFLGLVRFENQERLVDDNYIISGPLTVSFISFIRGEKNFEALSKRKDRLFYAYQKLYTISPAQGDYWAYSTSRVEGRPLDRDPEYIMLPRAKGVGVYLISPHAKYFTYQVNFKFGEDHIFFLPSEFDKENGLVLAYYSAQPTAQGSTAHRYEAVGTNVDMYFTKTVLPQSAHQVLKSKDPGKAAEMEAAGELDAEAQKFYEEFMSAENGERLKTYLHMIKETSVSTGFVIDEEPALRRMRDIMVARLLGVDQELRNIKEELEKRIRIFTQWNKEGSGGAAEALKHAEDTLSALSGRRSAAIEACRSTQDPMLLRAIDEIEGIRTNGNLIPNQNGASSSSKNQDPIFKSVKPETANLNEPPKISIPVSSKREEEGAIGSYVPPKRENIKADYQYGMPHSDSDRQHSAWDLKKARKIYIVRQGAERENYPKDEPFDYYSGTNSYVARIEGVSRFFKIDFNCFRNGRGGMKFEIYSLKQLLGAAREKEAEEESPIGMIGAYWYDFHSKEACDGFVSYLEKKGKQISSENPVEVLVDGNAFYRVVEIMGY